MKKVASIWAEVGEDTALNYGFSIDIRLLDVMNEEQQRLICGVAYDLYVAMCKHIGQTPKEQA